MRLRIALLALILCFVAIQQQPAQAVGRELLIPTAQPRNITTRPEQIGTERSGYATLNLDALALANASQGLGRVLDDPGIILPLFEDTTFVAVNTAIEPRPMGKPGYIWYGHIPAVRFSSVVMLVTGDGKIDLRVLTPGKNYFVDHAGNGVYRVSQIDTYQQRGFDDAVTYEPLAAEQQQVMTAMSSPTADDGSLVDVMVAYTTKAKDFMGGTENIETAIETTVALANITYMNSNVTFRLRLVHMLEVTFAENPSINLNRLANPSDGVIDHIHPLRDQYKADLVALIPGTSALQRQYCGVAFLPTSLPAPDSAFSVTEALCISDITYAHELGHNMGKAHDPANAGGAVHPYAYGYQDEANPPGQDWGDWVTVMAYSDGGECPPVFQPGVCPAIAWWSNPDQTYDGKPLGTASQNNALSLNQTALTIANYRDADDDNGTPTPTPSPAVTETPSATLDVTLTPTLDVTATPTTEIPPNELLVNTSFEIDADADKIPDGWAATSPVRKCNKPDKQVAHEGSCAVQLKGLPGGKVKVSQKLIGVLPPANADLSLLAYVKGKSITDGGGSLVVKVKYTDTSAGDNGKDKLTIPMNSGTYEYTLLGGGLTLAGEPAKIKVQIAYNGESGKAFVDLISLTHTFSASLSRLVPLP